MQRGSPTWLALHVSVCGAVCLCVCCAVLYAVLCVCVCAVALYVCVCSAVLLVLCVLSLCVSLCVCLCCAVLLVLCVLSLCVSLCVCLCCAVLLVLCVRRASYITRTCRVHEKPLYSHCGWPTAQRSQQHANSGGCPAAPIMMRRAPPLTCAHVSPASRAATRLACGHVYEPYPDVSTTSDCRPCAVCQIWPPLIKHGGARGRHRRVKVLQHDVPKPWLFRLYRGAPWSGSSRPARAAGRARTPHA